MAFEDRTVQDVVDLVAAKLDSVITADTTPSIKQVCAWLNDGLNIVMKSLPHERLTWAMHTFVGTDITHTYNTAQSDIVRLVSVSKYGQACAKMPLASFNYAIKAMPHIFSERGPRFAVTGGMGNENAQVVLKFAPSTPGDVEVEAIVRPNYYEVTGWSPDDPFTPPREIEDIVVDYAVIQGKIQDEEAEQAAMLWAQWKEKYQIEGQIDALGTTEAT